MIYLELFYCLPLYNIYRSAENTVWCGLSLHREEKTHKQSSTACNFNPIKTDEENLLVGCQVIGMSNHKRSCLNGK